MIEMTRIASIIVICDGRFRNTPTMTTGNKSADSAMSKNPYVCRQFSLLVLSKNIQLMNLVNRCLAQKKMIKHPR